jgi:hypothetical protein
VIITIDTAPGAGISHTGKLVKADFSQLTKSK